MGLFDGVSAMSGYNMIDLDNPDIIKLDLVSTSKGNQSKYYDTKNKAYIKGQFNYQGVLWKDYMVEFLSTIIGNQLNTCIKIAQQEIVQLSDGTMGCMSKDFAIYDDWVPIKKFVNTKSLAKNIGYSNRLFESISNEMSSLKINPDLVDEYLICMIILDFLLGNEDRHYNNFGVLKDNRTDSFKVAPLFDFGLGLFEHDRIYQNKSLVDAKQLMDGKPFDNDLTKPFNMIVNRFGVNKIRYICKDITIPSEQLFPNKLGYEYFLWCYDYMRRSLKL